MKNLFHLLCLVLCVVSCGTSPATASFEPVSSTQAYECVLDADCAPVIGVECVLPRCEGGACVYINAATQVEFLTANEFAATEACREASPLACAIACDDGEYCTDDLCLDGACVYVPRAEPVHCALADHPQSSAICAWKRCLVLACGAEDEGAPCLVTSAPDAAGVCASAACVPK